MKSIRQRCVMNDNIEYEHIILTILTEKCCEKENSLKQCKTDNSSAQSKARLAALKEKCATWLDKENIQLWQTKRMKRLNKTPVLHFSPCLPYLFSSQLRVIKFVRSYRHDQVIFQNLKPLAPLSYEFHSWNDEERSFTTSI